MYGYDDKNDYDYNNIQGDYPPEYSNVYEEAPESPAPAPVPSPQSVYHEVKEKKSGIGNKFFAVALTAVLGCGSLGIGLGIGNGLYDGLFNNSTAGAGTMIEVSPAQSATPQIPQITLDTMALTASDSDVVSVIKNVSNSVVSINVQGTTSDFFNRIYETKSAGSGIIFSEDSANIYIATNYHVISNASEVEISIDDTTSVKASPMGSDSQSDLAVIQVAKADLIAAGVTDYKVATFGDASSMEVGETVIAIGNALGEGKSATLGIISAKNKQIVADNNEYVDVIQTDAAINQGNSGGPLVNLKGQVIGINTAKLSATGVEGMGFAIPSNTVKEIVNEIMEEGSVERPYIGISGITITSEIKDAYSMPVYGVYVPQVSTNGGAREAGIKAGDIIVSFNGVEIKDMETLQDEIAKTEVGDKATVEIYRDNGTQTFTVEIKDSNANKSF